MSMILTAKALNMKVGNPLRKLVLVKLADNANDDGICFPSYRYIAQVCEIAKSTVRAHIDALIEMGLVSKTARKTQEGSTSNLYRLHLDNPVPTTPVEGVPSDDTPMPTDSTPMPIDGTGGVPTGGTRINHSFEPINEPKKYIKKSPSVLALLAEFGVEGQLAADFIQHRKAKNAPISRTALAGYQREADLAGISVAQAVQVAIERGWRGFRADWLQANPHSAHSNGTAVVKLLPERPKFSDENTTWWQGVTLDMPDSEVF